MFPNIASSGLTLPKVLTGVQKTLNIANQIIPLYVQVKPIIKNAQSAFSVAKELLAPTPAKTENISLPEPSNPHTTIKKQDVSLNNPVFFL